MKSSDRISDKHLKGLRELKIEHPQVKRLVLVCNENMSRTTSDKIDILSVKDFIAELWNCKLIQ